MPTLYNDVVIIGAGFSGINLACQLQRKLNFTDYVIYDRGYDFGGTWSSNKYPGCGVDIPAIFYSLSWFPNANFTSIFPPQEEILEYLRQVALRHNIIPHIKLRTEWKSARWSEKTSRWHIVVQNLENGESFVHEAKILVSAVGGYTNPKYPTMHGIDTFKGPVVHTAQWDQEYDLKDRNVVIIGNGCSASQVIPAIIDDVGSITQFIRSPQYYIPMPNFCINRLWRALFQYTPLLLMLARWFVFWVLETALTQFYEDKSGQRARQKSVRISQNYVRKSAPERYWPLLSPQYDLGCKRRILDNKYMTTLYNPKMLLTKDSVVSVRCNSVLSASGKDYSADFIILATGFEFTQWQADSVFGRNGISLKQHWDKFGGIEAYKTIAMNEFPNLFYLLGPNSGRGHTSVLYSIECSVDLVIKVARPILEGRAVSIEVRKDAEKDWCKTVQEALRQTVLTRSCLNQFSDPKTGWNFFSYPFSSVRLWLGTRFPVMSHWSYK
ncbi:FAD/NAD(P)-binding domain-containing protein [Cadophora sp. DSE1049]|nr:FAD/NAD(P)-binding domain-containing protein [Cadophora sp. DSE1049]